MAHGDALEGKWRGNWQMELVASTPDTTSEHSVSSITTADAHTSAASSRLNLRPRWFKWTSPFRRKTKSGFCVCAITFQMQSSTCSGGTMWQNICWGPWSNVWEGWFHRYEEGEVAVHEWLRMKKPDFCFCGMFKFMPRWDMHCCSWQMKDKLDVTCYFISLIMCSTCFGH